MAYSPLDALALARRNPGRRPTGVGNFTVFCNRITVPPPMRVLLDDPHMRLDGFVGPGHMSMVIGIHPYDFIAREYNKPIVVAGFDPLDLLQAMRMVLAQTAAGRAAVENQYARVVPELGNPVSIAACADVSEPRDRFEWRGLGEIDRSGLKIRAKYAEFDAERRFGIGYAAASRRVRADRVTMAHGGGDLAMRDLIEDVFLSAFGAGEGGDESEDQARLPPGALAVPGARLAFTTDSFVVDAVEFPGGDIGSIAVCGTVNDLAVDGAQPLWMSAAFIIEEGIEIALLRRIAASMRRSADAAGVSIVTGDTKVVERDAANTVFVTTSGVGVIPPGRSLGAARVQVGDVPIVNGLLGDHGAAILAARGEMALSAGIVSDCRPYRGFAPPAVPSAAGWRRR